MYIRTLRSRNIPYDVRQRQHSSQNKGQKPNIPPKLSSLQTDCEVTTEISTQPQRDRETSMYTSFQQVFTPRLALKHDEVNVNQIHWTGIRSRQ